MDIHFWKKRSDDVEGHVCIMLNNQGSLTHFYPTRYFRASWVHTKFINKYQFNIIIWYGFRKIADCTILFKLSRARVFESIIVNFLKLLLNWFIRLSLKSESETSFVSKSCVEALLWVKTRCGYEITFESISL